jgi:hypothetical protein
LRIKKEFGDLRTAIKAITRSYYVDGKLMNWKEMQENKEKWDKNAD